ncbi:hypothetical protein PLESTF_000860300 [Pleodorina starrii]|nr:hypothetical protein PLESTF_000860300 [Pleodorina starrii]
MDQSHGGKQGNNKYGVLNISENNLHNQHLVDQRRPWNQRPHRCRPAPVPTRSVAVVGVNVCWLGRMYAGAVANVGIDTGADAAGAVAGVVAGAGANTVTNTVSRAGFIAVVTAVEVIAWPQVWQPSREVRKVKSIVNSRNHDDDWCRLGKN